MVTNEHPQSALTPIHPILPRAQEAPIHLPRPLTPFIGRERERAAILSRIGAPGVRLLNLFGPGGVGKTRLAIAVAYDLVAEYPDGVVFVPLVAITDPLHVPPAIAQAMGLRETGRTVAQELQSFIGQRRMLIVLDNFEQVIPAANVLVQLLESCPGLSILTTSRTYLGVFGENVFHVQPMRLPERSASLRFEDTAACDAVAFFVERLRATEPEFALTAENLGVITGICHQLEGIPLGLELAAARINILSPPAVLDRLRHQLDFLTGGATDQPPHQQTMRDTIAWSYALLTPREQEVLRHISVFSGGFTVESASAVVASASSGILEDLSSLASKSLLRKMDDVVGESRLGMLAVIREFGLEKLTRSGEWTPVHQSHAVWFLELAEEASLQGKGEATGRWLDRLDADRANFRLAIDWFAKRNDLDRFTRLAAALQNFWITRGYYSEGLGWFQWAIAAISDEEPGKISVDTHLLALRGAAWLALRWGNGALAATYSAPALELSRIFGDHRQLARSLELGAAVARRTADDQLALELLQEALTCSRAVNDLDGIAQALHQIATVTMNLGRLREACDMFPAVIAAYEATGDVHGGAIAHDSMSISLYSQGDFLQADAAAQRAVAVLREVGDKRALAVALGHVGKCALQLGDLERAWEKHLECLPLRQGIGDVRGLAVWLEGIATLLAKCRRSLDATVILGATSVARSAANAPYYGNELIDYERTVALIRSQIDEDAFASALRTGHGKSIPNVIASMLTMVPAALVAEASVSAAPEFPVSWKLTAREADVLRLLASRLSDREIADALYISRYTVARHVTAILRKLDVRSRHDAARLVHDRGDDSSPTATPATAPNL